MRAPRAAFHRAPSPMRVVGRLLVVLLAPFAAWTSAQAPSEAPSAAWTSEVAQLATLPAPPVTLAPYAGGVAALLGDGRVVTTGPADLRTLARGMDGEVLIACGGRLLAIDGLGRLTVVPAVPGRDGVAGPAVSLHATPACLSDGTVVTIDPNGASVLHLSPALELRTTTPLAALPDAAPTALPGDLVLVATDPSLRYRHGVLGDEVEAVGAAVVDPVAGTVLTRWSVTGERVIEERRLVAFPAAGRFGAVATVSGAGDGGALVVLAAGDPPDLPWAPVAVASGLGQEQDQRWRHVLGAVAGRLYSVAAPHLGGPLERWTLPDGDGVLEREAFDLPITSHREGLRETDLGRLLPRDPSDAAEEDLLLLPSRTLDALHLVACDPSGCRIAATADLAGRLATAPWVRRTPSGDVEATIGREDGALLHVRFPRHAAEGDPE